MFLSCGNIHNAVSSFSVQFQEAGRVAIEVYEIIDGPIEHFELIKHVVFASERISIATSNALDVCEFYRGRGGAKDGRGCTRLVGKSH